MVEDDGRLSVCEIAKESFSCGRSVRSFAVGGSSKMVTLYLTSFPLENWLLATRAFHLAVRKRARNLCPSTLPPHGWLWHRQVTINTREALCPLRIC